LSQPVNNWLCLKLVGDPSSRTPKDAIGSTVIATIGGVRQRFDVLSGASYASQSDQKIFIGLGKATEVEKLEIRWAGGRNETIKSPAANRSYVVEEGKGVLPQ